MRSVPARKGSALEQLIAYVLLMLPVVAVVVAVMFWARRNDL